MSGLHTTDIFIVKLSDKGIDGKRTRTFLRTERRFFDITGCHPIINQHIDECNGLLPNAKQVSTQYLADLVAINSRPPPSFETASKKSTDTSEEKSINGGQRPHRRAQHTEVCAK